MPDDDGNKHQIYRIKNGILEAQQEQPARWRPLVERVGQIDRSLIRLGPFVATHRVVPPLPP